MVLLSPLSLGQVGVYRQRSVRCRRNDPTGQLPGALDCLSRDGALLWVGVAWRSVGRFPAVPFDSRTCSVVEHRVARFDTEQIDERRISAVLSACRRCTDLGDSIVGCSNSALKRVASGSLIPYWVAATNSKRAPPVPLSVTDTSQSCALAISSTMSGRAPSRRHSSCSRCEDAVAPPPGCRPRRRRRKTRCRVADPDGRRLPVCDGVAKQVFEEVLEAGVVPGNTRFGVNRP